MSTSKAIILAAWIVVAGHVGYGEFNKYEVRKTLEEARTEARFKELLAFVREAQGAPDWAQRRALITVLFDELSATGQESLLLEFIPVARAATETYVEQQRVDALEKALRKRREGARRTR